MTKKTTISILGCGWFGLPLAIKFLKRGYRVKGSTTSQEKLAALSAAGIEPYLVILSTENRAGMAAVPVGIESYLIDVAEKKLTTQFFNSDVLIIGIPPRIRSGQETNYQDKIGQIAEHIKNSSLKHVIYISSTSVFGDENSTVDESSVAVPTTESGKAILKAEQTLQALPGITSTILRFAGLVGPGRAPGRFFGGKSEVPNGQAPVNLVHLDDCLGICAAIIEKEAYGRIFHGVSPDHPRRQEYYMEASRRSGHIVPTFVDELTTWKVVKSKNVPLYLNYAFEGSIDC